MKSAVEPIAVPFLREQPQLFERKNLARRHIPRAFPFRHIFFRPEEQHVSSGEHQIVVPLRERHAEIHYGGIAADAAIFNLKMERFLGLRAECLDARVGV